MTDTLNIGTTAVLIEADEDRQIKVANRGATVYYGSATVSSTSNDGSLADGASHTFTQTKYFVSAGSSQLVIDPAGVTPESTVIASLDYAGADSKQSVAADLNLAAAAGESTDTSFFGGVMGNILGDALTKTKNYLGGLIGHYNLTGTKASTYPAGAVLAGIGDGVTQADGAVVAYIDGDDSTTTAGAAFKVRTNNSTAASGFDFALDAQDAAHDGYQPVDSAFYNKAPVRLVEDVVFLVGTTTPTNGTTGADIAGKGSLHLNSSDGKLRTNTNTKASPTWTIVGTQS